MQYPAPRFGGQLHLAITRIKVKNPTPPPPPPSEGKKKGV